MGTAGEAAPRVSETRIGDADLEIKYAVSGGGYTTLPVGASLEISFNRSSGAFNPLPGGGYCTEIVISKGGREKKLTLYYLTGKAAAAPSASASVSFMQAPSGQAYETPAVESITKSAAGKKS